jgi:DNA-binding response OmpR family regulator
MQLLSRVSALVNLFPGSRLAEPPPAGMHTPERRMHRRLDARKGTKVLIIDDSDTAQTLIKRMFTVSGYVAMQSRDADDGLFMACYEHPDLVILDIGLPGMNGFEVLKRMRKDPLARQIPVIMVSGNARSVELFRRRKVDVDGFVKKPFTRSAMFEQVERILDRDRIPKRANAIRHDPKSTLLQRVGRIRSMRGER